MLYRKLDLKTAEEVFSKAELEEIRNGVALVVVSPDDFFGVCLEDIHLLECYVYYDSTNQEILISEDYETLQNNINNIK